MLSYKRQTYKGQILILLTIFEGIFFKLLCQIQRNPVQKLFPKTPVTDTMFSSTWLHTPHKNSTASGLTAVLNVELGNGQLHQQGSFSPPLLARRPTQQGHQCLLQWENKCQKQILDAFKPDLLRLWLFSNAELSFFTLQTGSFV